MLAEHDDSHRSSPSLSTLQDRTALKGQVELCRGLYEAKQGYRVILGFVLALGIRCSIATA